MHITPTNPSDNLLMEAIKNHQHWALDHLYRKNRAVVWRYILNNSGNEEDAADILQEAVIVVYKKIKEEQLALSSSLSTYLVAVCKNLWYKKLRSKGKLVSLPDEPEILDDVEDNELQTAMEQKLHGYFKRLSEKCRQLLHQRFWEKKKMPEIAAEENTSLQVIKNRSSHCIKTLYEAFKNEAL